MGKNHLALIVAGSEKLGTLKSKLENSDILTAENSGEALSLLCNNKNTDIIIISVNSDSDCEFIGTITDAYNTPIIAVTDDTVLRENAVAAGAAGFVSENADSSEFCRKIDTVSRLRSGKQSNKHFSALLNNLPGGVAVIKTDGSTASCSYYNTELLSLFGMTDSDFLSQFSAEPLPNWLKSFIIEARNGDKFSDVFSFGEESNPQWIRLTASEVNEKNGIKEFSCVFLDMNAEKRQELRAKEATRKLRENESHLESMVSNAPGGISYSVLGDDGIFKTLFVSKGLAEIFNYPDYEQFLNITRKNARELIDPKDAAEVRKDIDRAEITGECVKHDFKCTTRDGRKLWLSVNAVVRKGEDGKVYLHSLISDITKEKDIEQELENAAYFDPLTALFNRHGFLRTTEKILAENPNTEYSILVVNIGGFKAVNDILGREIGDNILKTIAGAIKTTVGENGIYARIFADNFAILTPYSERGIHPKAIYDVICRAITDNDITAHDIQVYEGVYHITDSTQSVANMVDRASIACRSITGSFREHIAYYDEAMRQRILDEQEICDDSHRALANGEFCVYFQAIYGVKAEHFVSAEALVRWHHPTKGMISPGRFIPIFEKNGFIAELDLYVMEQVCKYHQKRSDMGLKPFPISVNVSRMSLYNPKLFDIVCNLTEKYNVSPNIFRIEITESAYNDNPTQLLDTVNKLREKGFPVLMDDFGSGYSSLNTLMDIPIDILKLDMKFMQGFEKNEKVGTIVTSVARLAKWLNIPMLAEGVETRDQLEFLASIGCSYIQGFYFAKPNPEEEFTALIAKNDAETPLVGPEAELGTEINELFGGNPLVTRLIDSVYGALGIYELYDNKLEVIRVNEGYNRIMGITENDNAEDRTNIWNMIHPDDVEISKNACLEATRTGVAVRAVVRRYDHKGRMLYLNGIHTRLGGTDEHPIICIAFNDVTRELAGGKERHSTALAETAKEAAFRSNELLRKTVRHIPVGVGIFKLDEGVPVPIYVSDKMYKLFGITSSGNYYNPTAAKEFVRNNILLPGTSGEYSFRYTNLLGESRWLKIIYRVLAEKNNALVYSTVSDISDEVELRRRENAQQQMYQVLLAETGTVIFNYSPDVDELTFRNPFESGTQYTVIHRFSENYDTFDLLEPEDRQKFAIVLKRLSDEEGTEELLVKISVDGYPKRYRAYFKSLCDEDGIVFRIIGKIDDVDAEMTRVDAIRAKAMYDSLCVNVYNKSTTEQMIKSELARGIGGTLMMIDVDDFKSINDSLGHLFGDEFLKKFAITVKQVFRDTDIFGRYGGDEFFVFLPHATANLAKKKGEVILEKLKSIVVPELGNVKCSIGIAEVSPDSRNYGELLRQADTALYQAKNSGKNCVEVFDKNTMVEGVFRSEEAVKAGHSKVEISSNPSRFTSLIMRVFSALYGSIDINDGINQMLELVGKTFDVSRVYIFEDIKEGYSCSNTFEWCNEGVESKKDSLQNIRYLKDMKGISADLLNNDGVFYLHDINEFPKEMRGVFEDRNVKSLLECGIRDKGTWRGFVGFDECRSNRFWTQEQIDSLVFISKVLSIFLLKDRNMSKVEKLAESFESVVDNMPQPLMVIDSDFESVLLSNNRAQKAMKHIDSQNKCPMASFCGVIKSGLPCPIGAVMSCLSGDNKLIMNEKLREIIKSTATEIVWDGKTAYLVNCSLIK